MTLVLYFSIYHFANHIQNWKMIYLPLFLWLGVGLANVTTNSTFVLDFVFPQIDTSVVSLSSHTFRNSIILRYICNIIWRYDSLHTSHWCFISRSILLLPIFQIWKMIYLLLFLHPGPTWQTFWLIYEISRTDSTSGIWFSTYATNPKIIWAPRLLTAPLHVQNLAHIFNIVSRAFHRRNLALVPDPKNSTKHGLKSVTCQH